MIVLTKILDGIRERTDAATEGPWKDPGDFGHTCLKDGRGFRFMGMSFAFDTEQNMKFIAQSRTDIDRLEKVVRYSKEFMERLIETWKDYDGHMTTEHEEALKEMTAIMQGEK